MTGTNSIVERKFRWCFLCVAFIFYREVEYMRSSDESGVLILTRKRAVKDEPRTGSTFLTTR